MSTASSSSTGRIHLSLTEWVVLAVLAEAPSHGFAVARELEAGTDLGRIVTVHRPLVYRALDRLVAAGLAEPHSTEPGDAGPNRILHQPSRRGRRAVNRWLDRPVGHIRDMRVEFLVKMRLNQRRRRDPRPLIEAQQQILARPFGQLTDGINGDVVDLWRHHNANAAQTFLEHLAAHHPPG